jgi:hypothetical protein
VLQRRSVVSYALARRSALAELQRGVLSRTEACDAHPDLLRAARHHGEPTARRCPLCRGDRPLVTVTYVYGSELGEASGRARATKELAGLASRCADLRVFVVEVCRSCSWNHVSTSFGIGTGQPIESRGTRRRAAGRG